MVLKNGVCWFFMRVFMLQNGDNKVKAIVISIFAIALFRGQNLVAKNWQKTLLWNIIII